MTTPNCYCRREASDLSCHRRLTTPALTKKMYIFDWRASVRSQTYLILTSRVLRLRISRVHTLTHLATKCTSSIGVRLFGRRHTYIARLETDECRCILLRCTSPLLAQSRHSLPCLNVCAFGGKAGIGAARRLARRKRSEFKPDARGDVSHSFAATNAFFAVTSQKFG